MTMYPRTIATIHNTHINRTLVVLCYHSNTYVIETINRDGKRSKRQVRDLWDKTFDNPEDAIKAAKEYRKGGH